MSTRVAERTRGFTREAVEELSHLLDEPAWLRERRLAAWEIYERTPMPSRTDEEWRRTDIRRLPIDQVVPFAGVGQRVSGPDVLPSALFEILGDAALRSGLLVQVDSSVVYTQLDPQLAAEGVVFTDLLTAARDMPELLQRVFMTEAVKPEDNKFAALHGAFWSGGTFLYVPEGVEVALPLRSFVWAETPGSAIFAHTLLVAEPGANVVLIDTWASPTVEEPLIASNVVEIITGEGAQVRYIQLQDWGRSVWNFTTQRALLRQDVTVNTLNVSLGSRLSKAFIASNLVGPGATAEMLGLYFADDAQHLDHQTRQWHVAPYASSDLLYKGALKDRARTVFSGLIKVFPQAQRTDAYQANRNLILSPSARADTIPNLEIGANDVRCTHGATVGQVEEEYIFYLMSRGISRPEAVKLIVDGFFDEVIERVPVTEVQETVRAAIARKIGL
ncbi:Fe-S cluster assembly protein SufD [Thermomicrobium sp.]|uniref:Fe-S cluster assembly protein SufD n=1 Tax=Thermomicrobium sp. TaxID=1969469 RepID=UPI001B08EC88|nr:Fe-S cluster assembly protein SufD [Thermomicrobium sp.]MBO9306250.1 Fe-S cluster assembly protein SufD [Thermomicrobium sp.]